MGTKGWTAEAETKFVKAELSIFTVLANNASFYDEALTTFRSQGSMSRVYRAFRPNLFHGTLWCGDCSSIGISGRTGSRPEYVENPDLRSPLFPTVNFRLGDTPTLWAPPSLEGKTTTVGIFPEEGRAFSHPSPVVLRMLPWIPVKVGAISGLEYQQVTAEQLMKPQLHYYDGAHTAEDLTLAVGAEEIERAGVGMSPDTVTESVMLSTSPPDFFAFNKDHVRVNDHGNYRTYINSEPTPVNAYSWESMLLTVAYPHQQRLRVLFYRDGRTNPDANGEDWIDYGWMPPALRAEGEKNNNIIRKLVIQEDRLQAWYVAPGTILTKRYNVTQSDPATLADSPFTTTPHGVHTWTRNDYDAAHAYAMRLARRYFKDQQSYSIELPRPEQPLEVNGGLTQVLPGMWIGDLVLKDPDSATGRNKTISALVESVSRDFATGRMLLKTAAPMAPVFYNNGTISPSLGGPVSPSLGGTMAQAVGKLQTAVRDMQTNQASAAPVVPFVSKPGGTGGGTGLAIVRVIGGNPLSGTDHPFGRPFIRATPFYIGDSELITVPTVPDWSALDLPKTWEYGVTKIVGFPDGLGIGQVVRPYSLGSARWYNGTQSPLYQAGPSVMNRASLNAARTKITLTGSSSTIVLTPDTPAPPGPPVFSVLVDDVAATISSYSAVDAGVELTLSAAVADGAETITATWGSESFTDPDKDPAAVPGGTLTVSPLGDKYTTVFLLNNVGAQGFGDGDYVMVDTTATTLLDELGESRTVYRIIGPVSSAILHSHGSYGASGQGAAFLGFN
jgi:hypothetical protein